jgi:hypothetical protein
MAGVFRRPTGDDAQPIGSQGRSDMAKTMEKVAGKTMKAAVLYKIGQELKIETLPVPAPQAGQILVKVVACGVCHSDLHAIDGD